jgi:hypothetical protein
MISRMIQKIDQSSFQKAVSKSGLQCPACGAESSVSAITPGELLTCGECGKRDVARSWVQSDRMPRGWANRPPADTKIQRLVCEDGDIVWDIPPSGKSGGFLFFAIFWCTITALVSGGFLTTLLFGEPQEGGNVASLKWMVPALVLFFLIFWAVGLGMMYVALRNKWARFRVMVTPAEVVLGQSLFQRVREKRVPRGEVSDVSTAVFYESNDTPVYGVQITAGKRNLKFGSVLRDDEKAWLVADLKAVLFGQQVGENALSIGPVAVESQSHVQGTKPFSLPIPGASKQLRTLGIAFFVMGCIFVGIGIFVIEPEDSVMRKPVDHFSVMESVFSVFTFGFKGIWLVMSSLFAVAGLMILLRLWSRRGVQRRLEGDAKTIAIREARRGETLREEVFPREEIKAVVSSVNGHSNGKPMSRVELILRDRAKTLAYWVDSREAETFVAEASRAMRER